MLRILIGIENPSERDLSNFRYKWTSDELIFWDKTF